MRTLFLFVAIVCAIIATILGFKWFGTSSDDWPGWIGATLTLFLASELVGADIPDLRRPR